MKHPITVAVLEDDRPTARLYRSVLESEGVRAFVFEENDACRRFVREQRPDLLIFDVIADTQSDGLTLLGQIIDDLGDAMPPVIIASALQKQQIRRHPAVQRLRRVLFMPKPFDIYRMVDVITSMVRGEGGEALAPTYC